VTAVPARVVQVEVVLAEGCDPDAVGAAVTVALCGDWRHSGPCRWPHNNELAGGSFRTLYLASDADAPEVRARIEAALRGSRNWRVATIVERDVTPAERALAGRLVSGPRR
jgi:hypothetical protein